MPVEIFGEQIFAHCERLGLVHRVEPELRHTSSEHSTMKVEQSGAKR